MKKTVDTVFFMSEHCAWHNALWIAAEKSPTRISQRGNLRACALRFMEETRKKLSIQFFSCWSIVRGTMLCRSQLRNRLREFLSAESSIMEEI